MAEKTQKSQAIFIRDKLERAGISQQQLADRVGVSEGTVSYWCSGKKGPSADKLPSIASALGCDINSLYREEVSP